MALQFVVSNVSYTHELRFPGKWPRSTGSLDVLSAGITGRIVSSPSQMKWTNCAVDMGRRGNHYNTGSMLGIQSLGDLSGQQALWLHG